MTLQMNKPKGLNIEKNVVENHAKYSTFKYNLRCNNCSWNISFYEASGSIYLNSHKMSCPFCKHREIMWVKSPLKSA